MKKSLVLFFWVMLPFFLSAQTITKWQVEDLERYLNSEKGLLVINFYASFCRPCNEELPQMVKVIKELKDSSVKFLVVSLDEPAMYPKKLQKFLKKKKITTPMVWLDFGDAAAFCPRIDARWSGSIPATLFLNTVSGYRRFLEDVLQEDQFKMELNRAQKALL